MAGEWIAYDLGLPEKPEVQELIDLTGQPVEVVVFRLLRLWGWAAMNSADGAARMTIPRLVRTCGADESFWRAVESVGWLEIDETVATVAIPGWDRRFSQAAKARLQEHDRKRAYEDRNPGRKRPSGLSDGSPSDAPTAESRRGEERREEDPPPPREASQKGGDPQDAWSPFRKLWNAGTGRPWKPAAPPDGWADRLAEPGWLEQAREAVARLPRCRFFTDPVTLPQFVGPKFVGLCLGGQYDSPKAPKGGGRPEDRPAVKAWTGKDAERFHATIKTVAKLDEEVTR